MKRRGEGQWRGRGGDAISSAYGGGAQDNLKATINECKTIH